MENRIALLLMSHGNFAISALESAKLIVGEQVNVDAMGVFVVDDVEVLKKEMMQRVETLDTSNGLIVLTDIIGGTPTNLASNLLTQENIIVCSGLNLPVLLEVLMGRERNFKDMRNVIETAYGQGLAVRTFEYMNREDEEDDLL